MKRWLVLLTAVLIAGSAHAAPNVFGGPTGVLMRDYTIEFDNTTADSPAFETVGSCTFKFTQVGSGSVTVYAVATRSTASGSGTAIATLSTDGQRSTTTPPTRWARAVASGTGLSGSLLHVECPAINASAPDAVDADGDGLYEFAYADQDWDGDGTGWKTCDCGGTTTPGFTAGYICGTYRTSATDDTPVDYSSDDGANNPAECRFHGERVWDDITDDIAALESKLAVGATVYFPPGLYPMKGHESGDTTSCWDSATGTFADTCATDPFDSNYRVSAILARKSGLQLVGAGSDTNGETDLKREGTYLLGVRGLRDTWTAANGGSTVGEVFCAGFQQSSSSGCGVGFDVGADTADVLLSVQSGHCFDQNDTGTPQTTGTADGLCDFDGATARANTNIGTRNQLCIDDTSGFATALSVGDLVGLTAPTISGYNVRYLARVSAVGSACGSGSEGLTVTFAGNQATIDLASTEPHAQNFPDQIFGSQSASTTEAAANATVVGPLDETKIVGNIKISGFTFMHQNYLGDGQCTDGTQAACDEGPLIQPGSGMNIQIVENAFVHGNTARGSGGMIDVGGWSIYQKTDDNVFRYNNGAAIIDLSTGSSFARNVVEDNSVWKFDTGPGNATNTYLIGQQGGWADVVDNRFSRNRVLQEIGVGGTDAHNSSLMQLGGPFTRIRDNQFLMNDGHCIRVDRGTRFMDITDNVFSCGDYVTTGHGAGSIWISSADTAEPVECVFIRGNRFLAGGYHSSDSGETAKILIGDDNDAANGEIGPCGIQIVDNQANMDSSLSAFLGLRAAADPDSSYIFVSNNTLTQGKIAAQIGWGSASWSNLTTGAATAPKCGVNMVGGSYVGAVANQCDGAWTIP